jgi:hypothetical protein
LVSDDFFEAVGVVTAFGAFAASLNGHVFKKIAQRAIENLINSVTGFDALLFESLLGVQHPILDLEPDILFGAVAPNLAIFDQGLHEIGGCYLPVHIVAHLVEHFYLYFFNTLHNNYYNF